YTFRTTVNHKLSKKINSRTGVTLNSLFFDNILKKSFRERPEEMLTFVESKGTGFSAQAFSQFKIDLLRNLSTNIGFHTLYLDVNNKFTFEPRAGLSWNVSPSDELSIAYGLHSQMEELRTYYSMVDNNGNMEMP